MCDRSLSWVKSAVLNIGQSLPVCPDKQINSEPAWTSQLGQFRTHALQQRGALFDYLIGAGKDRLWDAETERLGGLKIDHEIEAGRPFHG
jgi:hypothetical protein